MRILLFYVCLMLGANVFSQQLKLVPPGYYRRDTVYVMDGYRYRCDGTKGMVMLYNADYTNLWEEKKQVYKETGKVFDFGFGDIKKYNPILEDISMNQKVLDIVDNAFTKDFVSCLKGHENITVTLFLDSETGRVEEVSFWFVPSSAFAFLPISVYREIELQLINEVSYTPSSIGKQLNYIMLSLKRKPLGKSSSSSSSSSSGLLPKPQG